MAEEDIAMNAEELELFVDLWEGKPCLWDPKDQLYKNKNARNDAWEEIGDAFGRQWTPDQVRRKLDSLKTYYRRQKNKNKAPTGSASGGKKGWAVYDRIHSFLGTVAYNSGAVVCSLPNMPCSTPEDQPQLQITDMTVDIPTSPTDIDLLMQTVEKRKQSGSGFDGEQPGTSGSAVEKKKPKRVLGRRTPPPSPATEFKTAATSLINQMQEKQKEQEDNPHLNYAHTVADRFLQIKSIKRLTILKHTIDNVIHAALMEEMPDE